MNNCNCYKQEKQSDKTHATRLSQVEKNQQTLKREEQRRERKAETENKFQTKQMNKLKYQR